MPSTVIFADLKHTEHTCKAVPLGISMVAAYSRGALKDRMRFSLFRDPARLAAELERGFPAVACFSNYVWNCNLSCSFAERIKRASPGTVIIFGGPNYPLGPEAQKAFLLAHPAIDFYIVQEGEHAFVELFNRLEKNGFSAEKMKKTRVRVPNTHYLSAQGFVRGKTLARLEKLDELPSPYLTGMCDEFLRDSLVPIVQTTRGCPFSCTYCSEGSSHWSKISRFSAERIGKEVAYISKRTSVPNLLVADSNFGMYEEDLEICRHIARIQDETGYPTYLINIEGKSPKILKAAAMVRGASVSTAVQSTDPRVLANIKRSNIPYKEVLRISRKVVELGLSGNSFSEIILCLPGDTRAAHFKSITDVIDMGINVVRSHQFIILPGSEAASLESRKRFGLVTRFRVIPKTVSRYKLLSEEFYAPEIDEICVANKTMSFEDYCECRLFNLTVEIFYNDSVFRELLAFLLARKVSASLFVLRCHEVMRNASSGQLADIYRRFLEETRNLWRTRGDLDVFLRRPGTIEKFIAGEIGMNEQLVFRALSVLRHMTELHQVAFGAGRDLLAEAGGLDRPTAEYLSQLHDFCLEQKGDMLDLDRTVEKKFDYDFMPMAEKRSWDTRLPSKVPAIKVRFAHSVEQKELLKRYVGLYGPTDNGLGNLLSSADVGKFYRPAVRIGGLRPRAGNKKC